jgi:nucleoprotein TPR
MRSMLRELRTNNSKLLSQAEYNEERIKILSANTHIYKSQITALEEKNRNYNLTIFKHEQTIMHLKDEVLVAQDNSTKQKRVWKIQRGNTICYHDQCRSRYW